MIKLNFKVEERRRGRASGKLLTKHAEVWRANACCSLRWCSLEAGVRTRSRDHRSSTATPRCQLLRFWGCSGETAALYLRSYSCTWWSLIITFTLLYPTFKFKVVSWKCSDHKAQLEYEGGKVSKDYKDCYLDSSPQGVLGPAGQRQASLASRNTAGLSSQ